MPATAPTATPRAPPAQRRRGGRPPARDAARRGRPRRTILVEPVAWRWQQALDAAQRALTAAQGSLVPRELAELQGRLAAERQETAAALARSAAVANEPVPWLSPVPVTRAMLGLPAATRACLFDLDGVLTDSGALHAWAWGVVFDDFLLRLSEKTGWAFIPFDRDGDYRAYVDGRPRLEAVWAFLDSRGIHVPEGDAGGAPGADTARGLARRKGELVARTLQQRGVGVLAGARCYLEAAARAGIARSVISASASTQPMLERAGLSPLVDDRIDADAIRLGRLHSRPAPDVVVSACDRLGVAPGDAVAFTNGAAGVAAARAAGVSVFGVGDEVQRDRLARLGADRVVPSLAALLDRRLTSAASAGLDGTASRRSSRA